LDFASSSREAAGFSVTPALFARFQRLIHQETGIWLGDSKMALLCGRLSRRLRALEISKLEQYYEFVTQPAHEEERVLMVDAITTNETRFFRDPRHFEFLEQKMIPRWRADAQEGLRSKHLRFWSAGCSSGEEPYSLAMLIARHLPCSQGWSVSILATDISTRILAHARAGVYSITKSADIPEPLLKDHMLKGIGKHEGEMKVMPEIQALVDFQKLNLSQGPFPHGQRFDVIFCRNVLIYFALESKQKVIEDLTRCLAPNGLFFVGQAENLSSVNSELRSLAPAIYARTGELSGL
jgi:chemotaxis protein methyltransferase CheR